MSGNFNPYQNQNTGDGQQNQNIRAKFDNVRAQVSGGMPDYASFLRQSGARQDANAYNKQVHNLLQDQLDRQLQEQQLRAIEERLGDYPELQQHYQNLRMSEKMNWEAEEQARLRRQLEQQALQSLQSQQQAYQNQLLQQYRTQYPGYDFVAQQPRNFAGQQTYSLQPTDQQAQIASLGGQPGLASIYYTQNAGPTPAAYLSLVNPSQVEQLEAEARAEASQQAYYQQQQIQQDLVAQQLREAGAVVNSGIPITEARKTVPKKTSREPRALKERAPSPSLGIDHSTVSADKSSIQRLLNASSIDQQMDDTLIPALLGLKSVVDSSAATNYFPREPLQGRDEMQVKTSLLTSFLPGLPEEPELSEEEADNGPTEQAKMKADAMNILARNLASNPAFSTASTNQDPEPETHSNIKTLDYNPDPWWPTIEDIQKERRELGEQSDEDDFEDDDDDNNNRSRKYRLNAYKIRERFTTKREPGVLEKLPHCKVHRVRSKKYSGTSSEFLYCYQLTDLYPGEVMVCCRGCGTWQHAACGFTDFNPKTATKDPESCICDICYEEREILNQYPKAKNRITNQRMEWTRRTLATASITRHAPFSKHSGTYKWPPGAVPPSQFTGHARAIQTRHDKAVKQWGDMNHKLSKSYSRPRERMKARSKELERILAAIEDAEGTTDRHNMIVFLTRDLARKQPIGFEGNQFPERNYFDPADDDLGTKATSDEEKCKRSDCPNKRRFDSSFCSDGCGLHVYEKDLLQSLVDAREIQPSALREN